jgi:hypothetical protein
MGNDEKSLRKNQSCSKMGSRETLMDYINPAFSLARKERSGSPRILKKVEDRKGIVGGLMLQRWELLRAWAGFHQCGGSVRRRLSAFLQYAHSRDRRGRRDL